MLKIFLSEGVVGMAITAVLTMAVAAVVGVAVALGKRRGG